MSSSNQPNATSTEHKDKIRERSVSRSGLKEDVLLRLLLREDKSVDATKYNGWSVAQLQEEVTRRGIVPSNEKTPLIKRLIESEHEMNPSLAKNSKKPKLTNMTVEQLKPEDLKLYKRPITTLKYFSFVLVEALHKLSDYSRKHYMQIFVLLFLFGLFYILKEFKSPYQLYFIDFEASVLWYSWWVILGIASSIGLGTGLHTFMLYLGPFIARVAVLVYECNSLDFKTRGKESFICGSAHKDPISLFQIYQKVMFEALAWGAGTAIGELPPYFVARGAAIAGNEFDELDHISGLKNKSKESLSLWERVQLFMLYLLETYGFFGILLAASIPNPLFDLAGITCGHFLVPFATFFGATFIGKTFIKASIQAWSIILLFSKESLDAIVMFLKNNDEKLHSQFSKFLVQQKASFTSASGNSGPSTSTIAFLWNSFVTLMILYFLISIVESLSQGYLKRQLTQKIKK